LNQLTLFEKTAPTGPIGLVDQWAKKQFPSSIVIGVDEAGRGPLAGPVVAAAVVLPGGDLPDALSSLDDSKKLTGTTRAMLEPLILEQAVSTGIGLCSAHEIDQLNILKATHLAMCRAIDQVMATLQAKDVVCLIDGNRPIPNFEKKQVTLIKGDQRSFAIAAASILAKEHRDRLLDDLHQIYPHYGFDRHRGYGTRQHRRALTVHGATPEHRVTFKWRRVDDDT